MQGFVITTAGETMLARAAAGEALTITGTAVGQGVVQSAAAAKALTALIDQVAAATSSTPAVSGGQMSMIVEYRNDMNGGLESGFALSEFGIFASVGDDPPALLYYASLGDSPSQVQPESAGLDVHRFPVAVAVSGDITVNLTYPGGAFLTESALNTHNLSTSAHPDLVIDCGVWDTDPVAAHNNTATAHANLLVDGNSTNTADMSETLEEHVKNPLAHQNLVIDGNAGQ